MEAKHITSSWEVYKNDTKANLLYSTYNDPKWLFKLIAPIKDINGEPYIPDSDTYARVKFEYSNGYETEWFDLEKCCDTALPYNLPGELARECDKDKIIGG